jgi:hypothetical protein
MEKLAVGVPETDFCITSDLKACNLLIYWWILVADGFTESWHVKWRVNYAGHYPLC